jgi:hypothetical protein
VSSVTFAAETMLSSHGKAYKKAKKILQLHIARIEGFQFQELMIIYHQ